MCHYYANKWPEEKADSVASLSNNNDPHKEIRLILFTGFLFLLCHKVFFLLILLGSELSPWKIYFVQPSICSATATNRKPDAQDFKHFDFLFFWMKESCIIRKLYKCLQILCLIAFKKCCLKGKSNIISFRGRMGHFHWAA